MEDEIVKDLDELRSKTAKTMLNVTQRSIDALNKLSMRLDKIDDAMARAVDLDSASMEEILMYFAQCKESFKLKQDFVKVLSGYALDTSKVPQKKDDQQVALEITDADTIRLRDELNRRTISAVDGEVCNLT